MFPQHSQKPFSLYKLEKTFELYHFLRPKNCILEAVWNPMSVYFCISPEENVCCRDVVRCYMVEVLGERLYNFLKVARCLSLVKYFTIFHFNWNCLDVQLIFSISILQSIASIKTLKFFRTTWTSRVRLCVNFS